MQIKVIVVSHSQKSSEPPTQTWLEERGSPQTPGNGASSPEMNPRLSTLTGVAEPGVLPPPLLAGRKRRRQAQIGLATLAGLLVGVALLLAEPLQHRCGATFQVADTSALSDLGRYRSELLVFAWGGVANPTSAPSAGRWDIEAPGAGQLRISRATNDPETTIGEAEVLARGFEAHIRTQNEKLWASPTESESFLQRYVGVLTARLDDAQKQLDAAMAQVPVSDPRSEKTGLYDRWQTVRGDFDTARRQLREAAAEFQRLQQTDLSQVSVDPEQRERALMADVDLQQDLKELETTLTELKLHMLNVWQQSAASLTTLTTAGRADFAKAANAAQAAGVSQMIRDVLSSIMSEMSAYQTSAGEFAKAWNEEFATLQRNPQGMDASVTLDAYQRIKSLLSEFLFASGNRLATIREKVNQLTRDPVDDAQHHMRQSDAARAFAELQSAHHRFEFTAGALDAPSNFRLDSALRISRGLRRRVLERTREIDERLQKAALDRARGEQERTMAALSDILEKSRDVSDQTVDELIALQDRLTKASASSETFVAAVAAAELANNRLQMTRTDLDQARLKLQELSNQRSAARRAAELTMIHAGIVQKNVNLKDRLRIAGVGLTVTLLAVLLGQILLARFLWPVIAT